MMALNGVKIARVLGTIVIQVLPTGKNGRIK